MLPNVNIARVNRQIEFHAVFSMDDFSNPSISREVSAATDEHAIPNSRHDDQIGRARLPAVDPEPIGPTSCTAKSQSIGRKSSQLPHAR